MISAKEKSLCGRFLIFFNKERQQSSVTVFNGWKTISLLLLFWLQLFQPYLPENVFSCEELSWGMRCASLVLFVCATLVPQASICCLLIWLRRGAMERKDCLACFPTWETGFPFFLLAWEAVFGVLSPVSLCEDSPSYFSLLKSPPSPIALQLKQLNEFAYVSQISFGGI